MTEPRNIVKPKDGDIELKVSEVKGAYGVVTSIEEGKLCKCMNDYVKLPSFIREVAVQSYLTAYMNVPRVFGFNLDERLFIMEKMGKSLCMSMHKDKQNVVKLLYNLAIQYKYIHELGIVHGDISVANIVFQGGETDNRTAPRIIDFGGSQLKGFHSNKVSQSNIFSSPEILKSRILLGEKSKIIIDPESEIWSYGIIAYYLLTRDKTVNDHDGFVTVQNYIKLFGPDPMFQDKKLESYSPTFAHSLRGHPALRPIDADFISFICKYDARERPTWTEILQHPIFGENTVIPRPIYEKVRLTNRYPKLTWLMFCLARRQHNLDIKRMILCKTVINNLEPDIILKNKPSDIISNIVDLVNIVTSSISLTEVNKLLEVIMMTSCNFFNPLNYIDKRYNREVLLAYYFGSYSNVKDIEVQSIELYNQEDNWLLNIILTDSHRLIPGYSN